MSITDYSLYTVQPTTVLQPTSIEELSAAVRQAFTDGAVVVPWGSGTRQHIGNAPARYDIALVTTGMNRILEHTPADLVVTVEAGATLGAVQEALAQHGQWLPWDPATPPHATIGGLLASAASGPLRLGYGTPRDWMLGMRAVLGDGRTVKSGSKVVKNVAGYDAHKLHLGALGTLGLIGEVTFKLAPIPPVRRSLVCVVQDLPAAFAAMEALRGAPLAPISLVALNEPMARLCVPITAAQVAPGQVLVAARYAGVAAAVERQEAVVRSRCAEWSAEPYSVEGEDEEALWRALGQAGAANAGGVLLRGGARPGTIIGLADALAAPADRHGWNTALALYGGVGLAYARWQTADADNNAVTAALQEARAALPAGGYVVVEDAPPSLRSDLDFWGPPPPSLTLMKALQEQWNPRDIINRGRYLV